MMQGIAKDCGGRVELLGHCAKSLLLARCTKNAQRKTRGHAGARLQARLKPCRLNWLRRRRMLPRPRASRPRATAAAWHRVASQSARLRRRMALGLMTVAEAEAESSCGETLRWLL